MPDDSFREPDPFARISMKITTGEILDNGTVIEPIGVDGKLALVHSDGIHHEVVPQFAFGSTIYAPPQPDSTVGEAVTFPPPPAEYGSVQMLVGRIARILEQWGFAREFSLLCVVIVLASWVPELFLSPLTSVIYGSDMRQAAILFLLLACMCRRSFLTPQLSRALPFWLKPTLLVLTAYGSVKECAFWRAVNIRGVRVPSRRGAVESLSCCKVLFTDGQESLAAWGPDVLRFPLFSYKLASIPTERELAEITNALQPLLLMFRLRRLTDGKNTAPPLRQSANYDVCRQLLAVIQDEPQLVATLVPVFDAQQQEFEEARERDPYRALVESLWGPAHSMKELTVREIVERTNAILHSRGEIIEFDERVIGWKLRGLGLKRIRNGKGMLVRFSADVCRQLHEIARNFELKLPNFKNCMHCKKK